MDVRVFIVGAGLISPLGVGFARNLTALQEGRTGIAPLSLFPTPHRPPLPVGEIEDVPRDDRLPRTHILAGMAAAEALRGAKEHPDAVVLGAITGGMPVTETLLREGVRDPQRYRHHGNGSVAEYVAGQIGCTGTVLTVSTACSSGTVALKLALEMLRGGRSACVLAGGVDALCRMTYYGFNALQLVDPAGARPLDQGRRGMTVAEGAALFLLVAGEETPDHALAELLGVGLSCDAYHPAAPRPDGSDACRAIREALTDAGAAPSDIDYIHLHGTGTIDNDLAEARALRDLFGEKMPRLSSTKGATGHALAAAGALGAAVSVMSIGAGLVPGNSGCRVPDPELNLHPVMAPLAARVDTVLSNAFGFGGNNAALVMGRPGKSPPRPNVRPREDFFSILGSACLTGAGDASSTLERLWKGKPVQGLMPPDALSSRLPPRDLRRLKRLSRAVQSLAIAAQEDAATPAGPASVFFGTGWGPLSEMHDFLAKLFDSNEQFTSPTDFVGSVHNAPAGQAALRFDARGANVTLTGGDYSFEQALMAAVLLAPDWNASCLLVAADEDHPALSRLFDPSAALSEAPADGGAAFCLRRGGGRRLRLHPAFLQYARGNTGAVQALVESLGGRDAVGERYGAVFAGIPLARRESGSRQLDEFLDLTGFPGGVVDYRRWTGEFAAASAVAACCAARFVKEGSVPGLSGHSPVEPLHGKGILLVGLGDFVTAVEVLP